MSLNREIGVKVKNGINLAVYILMGLVFLPVLGCVFFVGNHMDYNAGLKLPFLLPSPVLFVVALVGMVICVWLIKNGEKIELTMKRNRMINVFLVVLFVILFFVNQRVTREIAYYPPWDIMVVRGAAYQIGNGEPLGYQFYFSQYPNNIAIVYILGHLYRIAKELTNYPYIYDFIWLQTNCVLFSVAGFFTCMTVKKLTRNVMTTAISFLLYVALVATSGWKIAAYTDTYGMIFPVMALFFYISYRESKQAWKKICYISLAIVFSVIGGFVKANIYILVIAIIGVEFLGLLSDFREKWKYVVLEIILTLLLFAGIGKYTDYIADEIGLIRNPEISYSWENYLLMGAHEGSTGSYESEDVSLYSQYIENKALRRPYVRKLAFDRLRSKGLVGNMWFWLRKMTMVFNDGTFGWGVEIWPYGFYYPVMSTDGALTEFLRSFYWKGPNMGRFNTIMQFVWYFTLIGLPGVFLMKKEEREKYMIYIVAFLGVFFYQMLFEARARYLFAFLPFLLALAVCGMQQYIWLLRELIKRGRSCLKVKLRK